MDRSRQCLYNYGMLLLTPETVDVRVRFVNYFTVKAVSAWMDRVIPDFEFILVVQGRYRFVGPDGQSLVIRAGEVLTIFPEELHSFYLEEPQEPSVISCIHCELCQKGSWIGQDYRLSPPPDRVTRFLDEETALDVMNLFRQCEKAFSGESRYRQSLADTLATAIIVQLSQQWQSTLDFIPQSRITEIVDYIRTNLDRPITRSNLALQYNMSGEYLSKLFKQHMGVSVCRFIQREKVFEAYRRMYEQGLSAKEAAFSLGFEDPAYFSRVFKKIMLVSPRQSLVPQK
jgi:AraC-like DNA-binding protein